MLRKSVKWFVVFHGNLRVQSNNREGGAEKTMCEKEGRRAKSKKPFSAVKQNN